MPKPDYRSPEAAAYRKLYKSKAWTNGRLLFLAQHPLCTRCHNAGRITPATVVHHVKPHKGDLVLFWDQANWQSVCAPCHDGDVHHEEARGFSKAVDASGWPTDSRHPANAKR